MSTRTNWDDDSQALKRLQQEHPGMTEDLLKYTIDMWRKTQKLTRKERDKVFKEMEAELKHDQKHQRREAAANLDKERALSEEIRAEQQARQQQATPLIQVPTLDE